VQVVSENKLAMAYTLIKSSVDIKDRILSFISVFAVGERIFEFFVAKILIEMICYNIL